MNLTITKWYQLIQLSNARLEVFFVETPASIAIDVPVQCVTSDSV